MIWVQVHLTLASEHAERAEACFEALGAVSVSLSDAADDPVLETLPGELRLWPRTRVTGLFEEGADRQQLMQALRQELDDLTLDDLRSETLADQVWERAWMDRFHAMRFGQRLWIRPLHVQLEEPDAVVVDLDPGLAFGTGTHPTTALCLEWLDGHPPVDLDVTDYGCGSGILAIAAARLGARSVLCIDHDPQALQATADNARANGVLARLRIAESTPDDAAPSQLVLANILAEILIRLRDTIAARVAPDGVLVMSGLLADQTQPVITAYLPEFEFAETRLKDGWAMLEARRVASRS